MPNKTEGTSYDFADGQRYVTEQHKPSYRSNFERDRARILHSAALRRLGAKTQVLGPGSGDFVRSRLTHSLEVAQVGRELGKAIGCDPDIVEAACLSHDLGHPPFGHNGEDILNELSAEIGGFEGNAQTLRLLVRLEPKVMTAAGKPAGLNLTRATLDAVCKYPWVRHGGPGGPKNRKFNVYLDDYRVFYWARENAPAARRCLEAQIMDLSDDIGYCVHDVEDAFQTGRAPVGCLRDERERAAVIDTAVNWYPGVGADELAAAMDRLVNLPQWLHEYRGTYRDLADLKNLSSQLIGRFVMAAECATKARYGSQPLRRYQADLLVPRETRAEITLLKGIAAHYVMAPRTYEADYNSQRAVLADLVEFYMENPQRLDRNFADMHAAAGGDAQGYRGQLRAVIDQVASLTDTSAYQKHAEFTGMITRDV